MKNLITDIEGILVGCRGHKFSTGVTVLSGPPFTAADVRGGGAEQEKLKFLNLKVQLEELMLLFYQEVQHLLDASSEVQNFYLKKERL